MAKCKVVKELKAHGKVYKVGEVGEFSAGEMSIWNGALVPVPADAPATPASPEAPKVPDTPGMAEAGQGEGGDEAGK